MSNQNAYRIVVLGYSSIGYGALANRYVNNICEPGKIVKEPWKKEILVDGNNVFLEIYDVICTFCRFGRPFNYNDYQGIIIIFDVADKVSFLNVENYLNDIKTYAKNNLKVILVGDDCGSDRKISNEEAEKFACKHNIHYFDISIRDNKCIKDAFTYITTKIHHNFSKI